MKKKIILVFMVFCIYSCNRKDSIFIKEIISDEMVTITPILKKGSSKDSVAIVIPMEFEIKTNNSSLKSIDFYVVINQKILMQITEYEIYDKKNKNKPINDLDAYLSSDKSFNIIIKEKKHLISVKDAMKILSKYKKDNKLLYNLKFGDTIKIEPYSQFRKNNPIFLNELRKIGDTLIITTRKKNEKIYIPKKNKINW
ncbi:hypothetical protein [Flavobacterium sharifuzzamanii]|uniref:hypothetical protein n=1 Tax=Flavobacterium sharifuzzamanii TaxID=2211133 RepID=UPI000DAE94DA|nr:hypothetical protein [Flavobacterium sharifuzzamanii]KAF2079027.1 hypothetical protein DMA14_21310 [Flavobacterium sharifuzzamanii]